MPERFSDLYPREENEYRKIFSGKKDKIDYETKQILT